MILKELKIKTWVGDATNCYIVQDEQSKETMVIDPAGDVDKIVEMLDILQAKLKYIYLTHCHGDHIGGVKELKQRYGGQIVIERKDAENLLDVNKNLSYYISSQETVIEADARVDDNDLLHLGELEFKVIHTPGHTSGGSCLYCEQEKLLFSGDTLFRGTWGRTDVPTGDFEDIIGATHPTYTTDEVTLENNGYVYQCIVSNIKGKVTSNTATLTVEEKVPEVVALERTETDFGF